MLSLIAPGLFSNLIIQPQQPAAGDAAAGAEVVADIAAAAPAGEAAPNPLNALPAPLQGPVAPRPDLPAKGLAPQPDGGEKAADGGETDQNVEPQISEEDLAKLVAEGKAKIEARQERQGTRPQQPSAQADPSKAPVAPEQAAPEQAAPEQAAAATKDISVPAASRFRLSVNQLLSD